MESFEGPFDLLLYLIRKQRLDLNEISVAAVTDQYMEYVEQIRAQNMELASDYLVMAADLMMIKSRLLLPVPVSDDDEEEEDPTARILREVAEYEKIQVAAQLLNALPTMGDGFWRGYVAIEEDEAPEPEVLPQELARVWLSVVKNANLKSITLYRDRSSQFMNLCRRLLSGSSKSDLSVLMNWCKITAQCRKEL